MDSHAHHTHADMDGVPVVILIVLVHVAALLFGIF
jgi:hypothetical protein